MTVQLYLGDCIEVMKSIPDKSIDAVITDPPYGLNTKSSYNGKTGKLNSWADLCNSAYWYSAWMTECLRVAKDNGCMWAFLNWRSLVTYQKASFDIGSPIESLLVWDKKWIGPGGQRGLRPSYEMVALFTNQEFSIDDRGIPDIKAFMWASHKPTGHPAEKPVPLMKWLMEISNTEGATILDPFMGSGTTGVACMQTGRNFIGIEIDERYFKIAEKRIHDAQQQMRLEFN